MANIQAGSLLRHICQVLDSSRQGQQVDRQLLQAFATRRDEGAFAELVRRHGPLVLGVCQRMLHDPHDAARSFKKHSCATSIPATSSRPTSSRTSSPRSR